MDILKWNGVNWKEIRLLKNLYLTTKDNNTCEESSINRGIRKNCCLSSIVFNVYMEEIIQNVWVGKEGCWLVAGAECIRFGDDIVLLAGSEWTMNAMVDLQDLNVACEEYGIRINRKKQSIW